MTDDEVKDPLDLQMRMLVNGEVMQEVNTGQMIYDIYDQIAYLSTVMTLEPGDLIASGTPAGVGAARTPPRFMKVGDVITRVPINNPCRRVLCWNH